jgi:hypothetical protein
MKLIEKFSLLKFIDEDCCLLYVIIKNVYK